MQNNIEAMLQHSMEGHRVISKIHANDPKAAYERMASVMACQIEMQKRGVRFLPAQVIKQATRKLKHSSTTES